MHYSLAWSIPWQPACVPSQSLLFSSFFCVLVYCARACTFIFYSRFNKVTKLRWSVAPWIWRQVELYSIISTSFSDHFPSPSVTFGYLRHNLTYQNICFAFAGVIARVPFPLPPPPPVYTQARAHAPLSQTPYRVLHTKQKKKRISHKTQTWPVRPSIHLSVCLPTPLGHSPCKPQASAQHPHS